MQSTKAFRNTYLVASYVYFKLLKVGVFRVSGLSAFKSLKAVGKNEL